MSMGMALGGDSKKLLVEAAEWHLLSLLFSCPSTAWQEQVRQLSREVDNSALRTAAELALTEASEGLYHSLLGPGGPAPAREASYSNSVQLGQVMSELAAYYDAFAYRPATDEVLDHVSVETGFVAYLRLKQAYALANSNPDHAAIAEEAAQKFMEEHLSAVAATLASALKGLEVQYLAHAGAELARRVGPPRRPQQAPNPLTQLTDDDCSDGNGEFDCLNQ